MEQYMNALTPRTVIVSIMAVNNETGAAYDIKSAFDAAHKLSPDIVTHTDAVQAYSHIPFSPDRLGADLVTISGHKSRLFLFIISFIAELFVILLKKASMSSY